jgi:hypothetical protein
MNETKLGIEKSCIFRETFNSAFDSQKNGAIIVGNSFFQNGILSLNYVTNLGTSFKFGNKRLKGSNFSVRLRYKKRSSALGYIIDFRTSWFFWCYEGNKTISSQSGTVYINGKQTNAYTSNDFIEVVITGIPMGTTTSTLFTLAKGFNNTNPSNIDYELIEIYNRILTPSEVKL